MSADCAHEIPLGPKLATPQLLFDSGNPDEYLSGCYALDYFNNLRRTIPWNRLNQKMNILLFNRPLQHVGNPLFEGYSEKD